MLITVSLILLSALLLWLLLAPIELRVDTRRRVFLLRWRNLARAELITPGDELAIRWRIGPWGRAFFPLRTGGPQAGTIKKKKEPPRHKRKKRQSFSLRKIRRLSRGLRIRTCRLDIDTGDYARNAWLFPLFYFLRGRRAGVRINFQGHNELDVWIQTSIINLLVAWLKGALTIKRTP